MKKVFAIIFVFSFVGIAYAKDKPAETTQVPTVTQNTPAQVPKQQGPSPIDVLNNQGRTIDYMRGQIDYLSAMVAALGAVPANKIAFDKATKDWQAKMELTAQLAKQNEALEKRIAELEGKLASVKKEESK